MVNMKLGEKIPMLVKKQGTSQRQIAIAIGADPSRVSEWVSGKGSPNLKQALRMARIFDVPLDYLADDEQDDPPRLATSDFEKQVWAIVDLIGAEAAWRRLVGEADSRTYAVGKGGDDAAGRRQDAV